jgi:hypothetical protein
VQRLVASPASEVALRAQPQDGFDCALDVVQQDAFLELAGGLRPLRDPSDPDGTTVPEPSPAGLCAARFRLLAPGKIL